MKEIKDEIISSLLKNNSNIKIKNLKNIKDKMGKKEYEKED